MAETSCVTITPNNPIDLFKHTGSEQEIITCSHELDLCNFVERVLRGTLKFKLCGRRLPQRPSESRSIVIRCLLSHGLSHGLSVVTWSVSCGASVNLWLETVMSTFVKNLIK